MGNTLYGRRVKITIATPVSTPDDYSNVTTSVIEINGGDGQGLSPSNRCRFDIKKDGEKDPNTCQIVIVNLTGSTRSQVQQKGAKITLEAGYQQTGVSRIFFGDIRTVDQVRNGGSWETTCKMGDGERSIRYARYNESFSPGVGAGDIMLALANATGLAIGNVPTIADDTGNVIFDQGYTVHGPAWGSLSTLVKSLGYVLTVFDGAIQITKPGEAVNASIPLINSGSGLLGSPEMGTPEKKTKQTLVKYKTYMRPCRPGAKEMLQSERYNGLVTVRKCQFSGDTHAADWYVTAEGVITPQ